METAQAVAGFFGEAPGDWRPRVRQWMGWNPLMDAAIAERWCRYRKAAREAGSEPEPAEFARRFADQATRLSCSSGGGPHSPPPQCTVAAASGGRSPFLKASVPSWPLVHHHVVAGLELAAQELVASGSWTIRWMARLSGRAP